MKNLFVISLIIQINSHFKQNTIQAFCFFFNLCYHAFPMGSLIDEKIIDVIFENEDFAILNKKRGMPTAPIKEGDASLLTNFLNARHLKEKVIGKKAIEAGLLHRLDTATSGLVLIAKTQNMFNILQTMQDKNLIKKQYLALCNFVPSQLLYIPKCHLEQSKNKHSLIVKTAFASYGPKGYKVKLVLPEKKKQTVDNKKRGKTYITQVLIKENEAIDVIKKMFKRNIKVQSYNKNITCYCTITQGARHQIRCHLASIGLPIIGDALYNTKYIYEKKEEIKKEIAFQSYKLELYAIRMSFPSPYSQTNEILSFSLPQLNKKNL